MADTTVSSSTNTILPDNVNNLTLTGTGNISGTGNALDNVITGNSGNNLVDGGAGADTMAGGTGNDTYVVDNTGDIVTEAPAQARTRCGSSIDYTLTANVENLTLTGTANLNGTGNTLDNVITGNSGNNMLDGGAGADTINAGAGNDSVLGGDGNDVLNGEAGDDQLSGDAGNDTLDGGAGCRRDGRRCRRRHLRRRQRRRHGHRGGQAGADTVQIEVSYTLAPRSRT